ncbi:unnamed protein product [Paramecium octaurelia]|uniref:Uncharacterized protein n=1 Tax=Paramecium octaurelia TaxID=43137 RepID=A0A8S1YDR2_PAROT|nr:unnamed protein product [Paramecium octaurelia]
MIQQLSIILVNQLYRRNMVKYCHKSAFYEKVNYRSRKQNLINILEAIASQVKRRNPSGKSHSYLELTVTTSKQIGYILIHQFISQNNSDSF